MLEEEKQQAINTLLSLSKKGKGKRKRKKAAAAAALGSGGGGLGLGGVGLDEPLSSDSDDSDDDHDHDRPDTGGVAEHATGDVLGDEGSLGSGSRTDGVKVMRSPSLLRRLGHSFRMDPPPDVSLVDLAELVTAQLPQNDEGQGLRLGTAQEPVLGSVLDPNPPSVGEGEGVPTLSEQSQPLAHHQPYDAMAGAEAYPRDPPSLSPSSVGSAGGQRTALSSQQV